MRFVLVPKGFFLLFLFVCFFLILEVLGLEWIFRSSIFPFSCSSFLRWSTWGSNQNWGFQFPAPSEAPSEREKKETGIGWWGKGWGGVGGEKGRRWKGTRREEDDDALWYPGSTGTSRGRAHWAGDQRASLHSLHDNFSLLGLSFNVIFSELPPLIILFKLIPSVLLSLSYLFLVRIYDILYIFVYLWSGASHFLHLPH